MNSRLQNHLHMVGACLSVAQSAEHRPVWEGQAPADFATDLAQLAADHGAVTAKAALAEAATGGAADAKAAAETALEESAYVLARALALHFKKTGDLDRHGKVDLSRSAIVRLRAQELVNQATAIRELAGVAVAEPGAAGRGVTAGRVAELGAALGAFAGLMSAPRGQIANRGALLREVETDVAALVEQAGDLDDLVVQFGGSEAGARFGEAWRRARIIVDSGGGHGSGEPAPAPTPASTPAPPA